MSKQQSALIRKLRKELKVAQEVAQAYDAALEQVRKKNGVLENKWLRVMQLVEQFTPVGSTLYHDVVPRLERNPLPEDGRMLQMPIQRGNARRVQDSNRHPVYTDLEVANLNEFAVILHERGEHMRAVMIADGKRYYVNSDFYKEVPLNILSEMVMELFNKSLAELKASKQ